MARRPLEWVNTPVLVEALNRYERGVLPPSLRLWVMALLELDGQAGRSGDLNDSAR
jgi:hypothetical protein